ncbi:hypothetical protein TWF703_006705 [Orbilia oligospora]|uniref:Uncharacterized protein n=1 Tax=Orbilia oligospora TaxID=2813651 RepID=A0A7C8NRW3_ORBOL|nr:hypothetical protein TWF703_006705 [Orbilia oligospora]
MMRMMLLTDYGLAGSPKLKLWDFIQTSSKPMVAQPGMFKCSAITPPSFGQKYLMAPTRFLARTMGPTLLALSASEYRNWHVFPKSSPAVVLLNGTILFACGVGIVQSHNVWHPRQALLVTALGWSILALGASRMAVPELILSSVQESQGPPNTLLVGMGTVGIVLCTIGYWL